MASSPAFSPNPAANSEASDRGCEAPEVKTDRHRAVRRPLSGSDQCGAINRAEIGADIGQDDRCSARLRSGLHHGPERRQDAEWSVEVVGAERIGPLPGKRVLEAGQGQISGQQAELR